MGRKYAKRASAAAILVALAAGAVVLEAPVADGAPPSGRIKHKTLTSRGPRSAFSGLAPSVLVTAVGTHRNANRREAFYARTGPVVADSESCAIWGAERGIEVQRGAIFRLHKAGKVTRAIGVLRDILGSRGIFSFTLFDSGRPGKLLRLGQADLGGPASAMPKPWRFCARVVGSTVSFKVWSAAAPEPAYGDPDHGASVTLPAGWSTPGRTGWYIGHLRTGDWARFTSLRTTTLG